MQGLSLARLANSGVVVLAYQPNLRAPFLPLELVEFACRGVVCASAPHAHAFAELPALLLARLLPAEARVRIRVGFSAPPAMSAQPIAARLGRVLFAYLAPKLGLLLFQFLLLFRGSRDNSEANSS